MTGWRPPIAAPQLEPKHRGYILANLISLDMLANTLLNGRAGDTVSARLGRSMAYQGWASRVSWPRAWVVHCYWAAGFEKPPR